VGWGALSTPTSGGAKERAHRSGRAGGVPAHGCSRKRGGAEATRARLHPTAMAGSRARVAVLICAGHHSLLSSSLVGSASPREPAGDARPTWYSSPTPFLLPARNANGLPWAPPLILSGESLSPLDQGDAGRRDFEGSPKETAVEDKTLSVSSRRWIKAPVRMV
jgi:hypothetical protein